MPDAFRPRKIISCGQTGASNAALLIAQHVKLQTGGWAPLGFNTERGPEPDTLCGEYRLQECSSDEFVMMKNIGDSHATVVFTMTPSSLQTQEITELCMAMNRPSIVIRPSGLMALADLGAFLERNKPNVLNVAGDPEGTSPGIELQFQELLLQCLTELQD